jgi:AcrR family transcriptional regulator
MATARTEIRRSRQQIRDRIVAAATELVRRTPYANLTVDEVMREAGFGRTIFYRHFDDLADLLLSAAHEAFEDLYNAQRAFSEERIGGGPDAVRMAIEPAVAVYQRHGPLLRAITEASAGDEHIAADQQAVRRRFDELAEEALRAVPNLADGALADLAETAHALNLMNESYLLETFGREPRATAEIALQTLAEIWVGVIHAFASAGGR